MNSLINTFTKDRINPDNLNIISNSNFYTIINSAGYDISTSNDLPVIAMQNHTLKLNGEFVLIHDWLNKLLHKNLTDKELLKELETSYKNTKLNNTKLTL